MEGAVGLMQNQDSLCIWTIAGPQLSRVIDEFENAMEFSSKGVSENRHHEQAKSVQLKFKRHVNALVDVIEEMGNPFTEDSNNLLKLDSRELTDQAVVDAVRVAERIGQEQYKLFVAERMQGTNPSLPL